MHGGPWARDFWGFNSAAPWLANRGYAVLQAHDLLGLDLPVWPYLPWLYCHGYAHYGYACYGYTYYGYTCHGQASMANLTVHGCTYQVNYRGSSGYSKSFLHKGDKGWGIGDMQHDLTDAVSEAATHVMEAATLHRDGGCNPTPRWRLQPCVMEAATLRDEGCNQM